MLGGWLRGVATYFQLGPLVRRRQEKFDLGHHPVREQVVIAVGAAQHGQALDDHDGRVAELEGQVRGALLHRSAARMASHARCLLCLNSLSHFCGSGMYKVMMRTLFPGTSAARRIS